ncbi:MAG: polysaccharide pyruvyl transferase family protein [Candidatus Omnitrophica bacterium]|nr:polysaccharide pyruvyl transferase family protein [Candidatus Omnitrophota bacterium]
MLKGLFYFFPNIKKVYLPVLYSYVENLILKKEGFRKNVEVFCLLNLPKLFKLILKTKKILFLFGDSLTGSYGFFSNIFAIANLFLLFLIGKKAVILPSTILPSKLPKSFLKFFLRKVRKIYIREKEKLKETKKINERTFVSKDLSIFYLNSKRVKNRKRKNLIIITIRNSFPEIVKIDRRKIVNIIGKQLTSFLREHPNYKIIFLPFQIGIRRKNDDRRILKEIYNSMENYKEKVIFVDKFLSLDEILRIIKGSKLLISSRFHPCVFACSLKTPFIALKENFKIFSFARENKGVVIEGEKLRSLKKYITKNLHCI